MHPPVGGSRASKGYVALPFSLSRFLLDLPRRFIRATATGVMLPTHGSPLQYSAAFPALLLLLLSLSGTPPASSFPAPCVAGETYWDTIRQNCVPCTHCEATEAFLVVVPCQPHKDTKCGNFSSLGIDWSWMRHPHPKPQKRLRAQYQRSWSTPSVLKATTPTQRSGMYRKVQRPRTPLSRGLVPESAARVMETRGTPALVAEKRVVLPSVREEEESWTWQYWLGIGCALMVLISATLFLALLVLKRTRYWFGSSTSSKSRKTERRKGQFIRDERTDHNAAKGEYVDRLDSDKCSLVMDEILLVKEKAAATGSLRDESENLYVKAPASSTVVTMIPGKSSVKVEVQGGDNVHRSLAENCLKFGCASRTEFTGRSSAV